MSAPKGNAPEPYTGSTLAEIERSIEEACGGAVLAKIGSDVAPLASPAPMEEGLPVRQHETGQIVAYVPKEQASGTTPVIYNGLVVGYYRDTEKGRYSAAFSRIYNRCTWWRCDAGEEWMNLFTKEGISEGPRLLRSHSGSS